MQAPPVAPAEISPAIDVGSIATTPQISDSSLATLINSAPTPARAASLRITEHERVELERGHTDDAIRELAHAISIDPSNSYAYFYLGRAYIARKDYGQALTFFKRAEIGVASNSLWLGETYAFEGVCLEQASKSADAAAAYQKALAASPGNLTARVGVTRLSAFLPASASASAPATDADQAAPDEPEAAPSAERSTSAAARICARSTRLSAMLVLGIESSCDDAAAAVIETTAPGIVEIRSSTVANQDDIHRAYGGIVPELASRNHVVTIAPVIERALDAAGCRLADVEGIAVTRGPGLVGSLLVGLMFAKGLAQASGVAMVGVNHIEGHLLAPLLENRIAMPYLALVVSGGHTALFAVEDFGRYRRIGRTRDDAAGEAFDKVAKLMGLGYPGGRVIDEMSQRGNRKRVRIPRAHVKGAPMDFSFSGVKTAVATILATENGRAERPEDLAASFQEAVVEMLVKPTIAAARELGADTIALTGGVAANSRLRDKLAEAAAADGRRLVAPALKYCTDNAAMIALAGSYRLLRGERDLLSIDAEANLAL